MREIESSIEIDAPIDWVWEVVMDFASYRQWNPFMVELIGERKVGAAFVCVVKNSEGKEIRFPSKISEMNEQKKVTFKSTLKKGFLSDDHLFNLESLGPNKTRFSQNIIFKGIVVPFLSSMIKETLVNIDQMNKALKMRCESK